MVKLINRLPGLRLLKSSIPGLASRMHVEWLDKPQNSTHVLKALPRNFDIKRHSQSIFYLYAVESLLYTVIIVPYAKVTFIIILSGQVVYSKLAKSIVIGIKFI